MKTGKAAKKGVGVAEGLGGGGRSAGKGDEEGCWVGGEGVVPWGAQLSRLPVGAAVVWRPRRRSTVFRSEGRRCSGVARFGGSSPPPRVLPLTTR